jgi:hypothetical protein
MAVAMCAVLMSDALSASKEQREQKVGPAPTKETKSSPKDQRNPRGNKIVTPPAAPKKITVPKNQNATSTVRDVAKICGNNGGECYVYWLELTNPHDATAQGKRKAELNYRQCMLRCTSRPKLRAQ